MYEQEQIFECNGGGYFFQNFSKKLFKKVLTNKKPHVIIFTVEGLKAHERKKEVKKMTKTKMLNFIESTGMVIDFDRKYLMRKSKEYIQGLYNAAIDFATKKS